ncbi:MAG: class I SAM-dependent methyltransferase [Candidatus Thermoplasmatota archaeon]|nr:class I SAM-dependent methyltransferase [Candidatus Thermoplasmatota archaeon]
MAIPFYDRWSWGQFLRKPPIKEGKLLDVCCFYGEFLSIAVGMYDYKVKGIDINRAAVEQGRKKYGLELLSITIEDFAKAYPKEKFDVVTFF